MNRVVKQRFLSPAMNLTERVTEELRINIKSGLYAVGQSIPTEQQVGVNFGVSRSVVREAIARLKADGLLKSRQGLGVFVTSIVGIQGFQIANDSTRHLRGIRDILDLRMGIEVEAAGLAAVRRHARHLAEMRRALQAMEASIESDSFEFGAQADLRFHRAICAAAQNPHFTAFFDYLRQRLEEAIILARRRSAAIPGRGSAAQAEHELIFAAIEKQNPDAARKAARKHVMNTSARLASQRDVEP